VNIGFEVLTAKFMKNSIFWNKTPCSLLKINRTFRTISQARNQREAGRKQNMLSLFFDHEERGEMFLRSINGLHGVISQKIEHFIIRH
jgi:hypothetical protein